MSQVPLDHGPEIYRLGTGQHGQRRVEDYCLPDLWALHRYRYPCRIDLPQAQLEIRPGDLTLFPPQLPLRYRFPGPGCRHQFCLFRLTPCPAPVAIAMQLRPAPARSAGLEVQFQRALDAAGRARARVALHELLYQLAEGGVDQRSPEERVAARIEAALGTELSVAELAAEVGVSADHLTRRFKARYGATVIGYLRERRLQQAHRLLTASAMPPAQVARNCGIADLQYFNKQIRARFGASPRQLQVGAKSASQEERRNGGKRRRS